MVASPTAIAGTDDNRIVGRHRFTGCLESKSHIVLRSAISGARGAAEWSA